MKKLIFCILINATFSTSMHCSCDKNFLTAQNNNPDITFVEHQKLSWPKQADQLSPEEAKTLNSKIRFSGGFIYPKNHPAVAQKHEELKQATSDFRRELFFAKLFNFLSLRESACKQLVAARRKHQEALGRISDKIQKTPITQQQVLDLIHQESK